MQKLIKQIRTFARDRDWEQFHSPKNLAMALSVEVAEIVEHFQWLTQEQSFGLIGDKREQIKDEIGDVLIYLVNLSDKCGIDPLQAAHDKIEKNRAKYPSDKVRGKRQKYNEYD